MNIKELRLRHSLTQQELSEKTGIPKGRINAWEQKGTKPKVEDTEKLQKFFEELENQGSQKYAPRGTKVLTDVEEPEEIYRTIVEGNTEYLLIPRSVLQEKYRLVAMEQIERDNKKMESDSNHIDKLMKLTETLVTKLAVDASEVQKSK